MSILVQTPSTHMSTTHRIIRMVIGMAVVIGCAVAEINYSLVVSGLWFALPMLPAVYLTLTGFTGYDPLTSPRKGQPKRRNLVSPIGACIIHAE